MNRIVTPPPIPERPVDGHKGMFGRVLVVGGSEEMIGAPVLSGTSALRSGAGLVQIAMPKSVLATALTVTPELIGLSLGAKSQQRLDKAAKAAGAVVFGPGMEVSAANAGRLMKLLAVATPMVIDASAFQILAASKGKWIKARKAPAILTPHPGEMVTLAASCGIDPVDAKSTDDDERIALAIEVARKTRQTIVFKGHRTVVTDGERVYVNHTGDSTLSKAGSGDVLCGILATFLAQKMVAFDAAVAGAWIHGYAGELAGKRLGRRSAIARDVVDEIGNAIGEYERKFGTTEPR